MRYRRAKTAGATYFFTVNLANRNADTLVKNIDVLRDVMTKVKTARPFAVVAMVVLPEHLHAIWRLPPGDSDYQTRWSLLKGGFSRRLPPGEHRGGTRAAKRERGIWQRRYWEHQIRDDVDLERHVEYVHFNPVKHGWVTRAVDWPHSTLHGYIERGMVNQNWGGSMTNGESGFGER
jgi:putative transposase